MDIVFLYVVPYSAVIAISIAVVLLYGGTLQLGQRAPQGYLVYFVVPLIVAIAAQTIASGRNYSLMDPIAMFAPPEPGGWAKWVQRGATLCYLVAAIERLTTFTFRAPQQADRPTGLMLAFVVLWLGMVAFPSAFGARPTFSHDHLYPLVIGLAALTTTNQGAKTAIRVARDSLLAFVILGFVLLAVRREMVLAPYAGGLIPAFPWRYSGAITGPNAMGPMCVLALMLLKSMPYRRAFIQGTAVLLVLTSLLLTQSKTSWLAALLCWLAMSLAVFKRPQGDWFFDERRKTRRVIALLLCLTFASGVLVAVVAGVGEGKVARFLSTRAGADVLTLTGRDAIWRVALETFGRYPLFGYGPTIWDPQFRISIGNPAAFHAHNQLLNVMAASGIAGLAAFLVYIATLVGRFWNRWRAYQGLAFGVMVLLLVRSLSEVPFNMYGFGVESLAQIFLLMLLAGGVSSARHPSSSASMGHGVRYAD
jgi:O-antigen ligase